MFSVVIPVYRNEGSISDLLGELRTLSQTVPSQLEAVFVVDGSPDRCYEILHEQLAQQPFSSQLLLHSRNFGSFAAIRTGLINAKGTHLAIMAADLQEPIELVQQSLEVMSRGEADIAIGFRQGRADPMMSRIFSRLFWGLYRRTVLSDIPEGGVDVFACTAAVRDELVRLEELNSSLVGLLFWVGFRRKLIPYVRQPRRHGDSAWTFARKVRYLLDSVYSFSDLPIRILKYTGLLSLLGAMLMGMVVLVAKLTGWTQVPGYTATILAVMVFGGFNALGFGILGEYVWRTFENTKRRPVAIVRAAKAFERRETR